MIADEALVTVTIVCLVALLLILVAILATGAARLWQFSWVARQQLDYLQERLHDERADRDEWRRLYFAEIDRWRGSLPALTP